MRTAAERRAEAARAQQITEELVQQPKMVTVKNLMTGKDVSIRAEDKGTVCDPSQERFWTM